MGTLEHPIGGSVAGTGLPRIGNCSPGVDLPKGPDLEKAVAVVGRPASGGAIVLVLIGGRLAGWCDGIFTGVHDLSPLRTAPLGMA